MVELRSITAIPCRCPLCGWKGVTGDCEPSDGGDLGCPLCSAAWIEVEYNEHERSLQQQKEQP